MATAATATATAALQCSPKTSITCLSNKHILTEPFQVKFDSTKKTYSPLISIAYKRRIAVSVSEEQTVNTTEEEVEETQGEGEGESDEVEMNNTKLYFGNLPYHCDSAQLAGIVQDYGNPELVEVLYNRDTGRSRGFAFVTMSSIEDCKAVIDNLDGSEYGGRYLRVNFADNPVKRAPLFPETEHKLFVGNLSWSVNSESLYQAFQEYGNVVGARVLFDGETGKSRGYGFVCYSTRSEMESALASLNGVELEGRGMRISMAEGKKL
ncbi:hypothetical protein SOVF_032110 [Spinacia oleracea]|nr:hypothetical protein SOVF_032110 [Spinacia oleracea]